MLHDYKRQSFYLVSFVLILIGSSLAGAEYLQGAGLKSIFLHDYCTIIHQLPPPGQRKADSAPPQLTWKLSWIRANDFFDASDFFCFCAQWKRERKPRCFDLLTRYPICCTDWETCWENFSNYFVWELTNVYTLHRQLYVHCLNYSISRIKPLFKLFTSII